MNLLITTLLLNYIAIYFGGYMVSYPFKDRTGSAAMAQTPMIDQSIWLPKLFQGMGLHAGFIIAIVAAILIYWFTHKTVTGYEIRMLGSNPSFATYGGVRRIRMMMLSMVISGGLAGLAGAGKCSVHSTVSLMDRYLLQVTPGAALWPRCLPARIHSVQL